MNIVLLAIGKRGYFFAAYNLAYSIKYHNPDAKILLVHDGAYTRQIDTFIFDHTHEVNLLFTHQRGVFDAGGAKLGIYSIATQYFKEYLYLDVDAICLKNLQPFYDSMTKDFHIDVLGKGTKDGGNVSMWAKNEDVWNEFKLSDDAEFLAVQSSWHYAKKIRGNTSLFNLALKLNKDTFADTRKLSIKWGGGLPDELVMGGALAQKGIDPSIYVKPIFYGSTHKPISEVRDEHYILSLYGNGNGRTMTKLDYFDFYDREMLRILRENGLPHKFKVSMIMNDKLVNK